VQKLAWEQIVIVSSATALLRHENGGPTIQADVGLFQATHQDQVTLWHKKHQTWDQINTTPYALVGLSDLDPYVSQYTCFYLQRVQNTGAFIDRILLESKNHLEVV
jgi:hypothetical protein